MTDRELIEMAAKAAGEKVPPRFYPDGAAVLLSGQRWNPLTDDGDALRLAVKLRIDLQTFAADRAEPWVRALIDREGRAFTEWPAGGNEMSATRRAIVRAAAAIGGAR